MSSAIDPLAAIVIERPSAAAPMGKTKSGNHEQKKILLIGGLAAMGIAALLAYVFIFKSNKATGEARAKNETPPPLVAELTPPRVLAWSEESFIHDDGWKKRLAALNQTNVQVAAKTASRGVDDPWRGERWVLEFKAGHTLESYSKEINSLGIEIGLIDRNGNISYVGELVKGIPKTRTGKLDKETRFYMLWRETSLQSADVKLFAAAKLNSAGKIAAHFFSAALENQMIERELAFARGRPLGDIRKTYFGVDLVGAKLELVVVKQEYQDGRIVTATSGKS